MKPKAKTLVVYLNAFSMEIHYLICELPVFEDTVVHLKAGSEHEIIKELWQTNGDMYEHIKSYNTISDIIEHLSTIQQELSVTLC